MKNILFFLENYCLLFLKVRAMAHYQAIHGIEFGNFDPSTPSFLVKSSNFARLSIQVQTKHFLTFPLVLSVILVND